MTVHRPPESTEALLLDVINMLSAQDIKDATGKTVDHFRKVTQGKAALHYEDAAKLDAVLEMRGRGRLFAEHYKALVGNAKARLSNAAAEPVALETALLLATSANGALCEAVLRMDQDGKREPHEIRQVEAKARELIASGRRVLAALNLADGTDGVVQLRVAGRVG